MKKTEAVAFLVGLSKVFFKTLSALIKTFKGIKIGQIGSAVLSIGAYSLVFSWQFAILIVSMLFIHEMGHLFAAATIYKMKVRGVYFIPFLGAVAMSEEQFPSRKAELVVALMGPLWGFSYAFMCLLLWFVTKNAIFGAAASWTAMINLFNLLPIYPLDGGRVFRSIAVSINRMGGLLVLIIGFIGAIVVAWQLGFMLIVMLFVLGSVEILMEFRQVKDVGREYEDNKKQLEKWQKAVEWVKDHFCSDEGTVFFDYQGKTFRLDEFKIISVTNKGLTLPSLMGPIEPKVAMSVETGFKMPLARIFKEISLNKLDFENPDKSARYLKKLDLTEAENKYKKIVELNLICVQLILQGYKIAQYRYQGSLMSRNPMTKTECLAGGLAYALIGLILFAAMYVGAVIPGAGEAWEIFK